MTRRGTEIGPGERDRRGDTRAARRGSDTGDDRSRAATTTPTAATATGGKCISRQGRRRASYGDRKINDVTRIDVGPGHNANGRRVLIEITNVGPRSRVLAQEIQERSRPPTKSRPVRNRLDVGRV